MRVVGETHLVVRVVERVFFATQTRARFRYMNLIVRVVRGVESDDSN